jgi:hypothetical protein
VTMQNEPITAGKGVLRHRIHELEAELTTMRNAPIKQEAERLAVENAALRHRVEEMEVAATTLVEAALNLARKANASHNSP